MPKITRNAKKKKQTKTSINPLAGQPSASELHAKAKRAASGTSQFMTAPPADTKAARAEQFRDLMTKLIKLVNGHSAVIRLPSSTERVDAYLHVVIGLPYNVDHVALIKRVREVLPSKTTPLALWEQPKGVTPAINAIFNTRKIR